MQMGVRSSQRHSTPAFLPAAERNLHIGRLAEHAAAWVAIAMDDAGASGARSHAFLGAEDRVHGAQGGGSKGCLACTQDVKIRHLAHMKGTVLACARNKEA